MASHNEYESPKPTVGDHLHTLARAGIGSIPLVGEAATELLNMLVTPPLEKRRREWMESVGEALRALEHEGCVRLEDLQTNDVFIDTVMHASQTAVRNNQQEKIDALRNAVLNAALPNPPEESIQQIFLNYVDTFTVWHLRILRLFDDPKRWFKENGRQSEFSVGSLSVVLIAAFPELDGRRYFNDLIVKDLYSTGLLGVETLYTMMSGSGLLAGRSTDIGKKFINFITQP
jgi:hypothetical protein